MLNKYVTDTPPGSLLFARPRLKRKDEKVKRGVIDLDSSDDDDVIYDGELEMITCDFHSVSMTLSTTAVYDEPKAKKSRNNEDLPYDGVNKAVCAKADVGSITRAGVVIKKVGCYTLPSN
jgi:hypothetical protein